MELPLRFLLKEIFEGYKDKHEESLESVYNSMKTQFPEQLKKEYRWAAKHAKNMAAEMYNAAMRHKLDELYEEIWSQLPRDARRELSRLYKHAWNDTEQGRIARKRLIEMAQRANISKLYYYAAHGMYDQLAKELGVSPSEVPHNFAGAASLVNQIKLLRRLYRAALGKDSWAKAKEVVERL